LSADTLTKGLRTEDMRTADSEYEQRAIPHPQFSKEFVDLIVDSTLNSCEVELRAAMFLYEPFKSRQSQCFLEILQDFIGQFNENHDALFVGYESNQWIEFCKAFRIKGNQISSLRKNNGRTKTCELFWSEDTLVKQEDIEKSISFLKHGPSIWIQRFDIISSQTFWLPILEYLLETFESCTLCISIQSSFPIPATYILCRGLKTDLKTHLKTRNPELVRNSTRYNVLLFLKTLFQIYHRNRARVQWISEHRSQVISSYFNTQEIQSYAQKLKNLTKDCRAILVSKREIPFNIPSVEISTLHSLSPRCANPTSPSYDREMNYNPSVEISTLHSLSPRCANPTSPSYDIDMN